MIDISISDAMKAVEECEETLADLKAGGLREGDAEGATKMQFAMANSAVDHAGRVLGRPQWIVPFNPPAAHYAGERGGREMVRRFDPTKSSAFIKALEANLKAMKKQLAALT